MEHENKEIDAARSRSLLGPFLCYLYGYKLGIAEHVSVYPTPRYMPCIAPFHRDEYYVPQHAP